GSGGRRYLPSCHTRRSSDLLARVEALARRGEMVGETSALKAGDLEIDQATRIARRGGRETPVTDREFRILDYMTRNAGRVVTRRDRKSTRLNSSHVKNSYAV